MHQYQFLPIDVHKDSKNERFIYISIPFDSQRITSRLFLTKNRYCSRVTHHKTQARPRRNKTLIPRRTTSCLHHAPSKQITFYSARISAEYSISNPSRTTPATLFTWLDNCALSTPGVYPRHAISNRPSECKWREVK